MTQGQGKEEGGVQETLRTGWGWEGVKWVGEQGRKLVSRLVIPLYAPDLSGLPGH